MKKELQQLHIYYLQLLLLIVIIFLSFIPTVQVNTYCGALKDRWTDPSRNQ